MLASSLLLHSLCWDIAMYLFALPPPTVNLWNTVKQRGRVWIATPACSCACMIQINHWPTCKNHSATSGRNPRGTFKKMKNKILSSLLTLFKLISFSLIHIYRMSMHPNELTSSRVHYCIFAQCVYVCISAGVCMYKLVSARKEGISSSNLIILTLSEGHRGIMEVKYCIPFAVWHLSPLSIHYL